MSTLRSRPEGDNPKRKLDYRWLPARGAAMVVNSEAIVRDAKRDGLPLADLIRCRCADCHVAVFVTMADVVSFHADLDTFHDGHSWPHEMLCPTCHECREERREARCNAALWEVAKAADAQMIIADPVERAQAVLPAAVAELCYWFPKIGRELQKAAEIAARWQIGLDILLISTAQHVDEAK
jgi:hypothetical protein